MRRPTPVVLALAASLLAGCGTDAEDELEAVRSELDARDDRDRELSRRVSDLESRLDDLDGLDEPAADPERLDELAERLESVEGALDGLEDAVAAEEATREELAEELGSTAAELRSTLVDMQGEVEGLTAETDELRVLYEILRERVDEMDREG